MAYSAPMFCVRINQLEDLKRINLDQRINLLPTSKKRIPSIKLIPKVNWSAVS